MKDQIACFHWNGSEYVVTLGLSDKVLARFRTLRQTRGFVEAHNAKLAATLKAG